MSSPSQGKMSTFLTPALPTRDGGPGFLGNDPKLNKWED